VHAVGGASALASSDGGVTWREEQLPVSSSLQDVSFVDERHGWAVGTYPSTIIAYDSAPPITTATGADALWHNSTQTIRLSSADDQDSSGVSGVKSVTSQLDSGAANEMLGDKVDVLLLADAVHHVGDGVHSLTYHATDNVGNIEAAKKVTVRIDTRPPVTTASTRVRALHERTATLRCVVSDRAPNGGKATVTIRIRNAGRRIVRTLKLGVRRVNVVLKAKFKCTLPAGKYRYFVYATDIAGNTQKSVGVNTLIVK
jgi:hypothetical protein